MFAMFVLICWLIYIIIYIYSYSFVNTHMVWHLIVKDDRLF